MPESGILSPYHTVNPLQTARRSPFFSLMMTNSSSGKAAVAVIAWLWCFLPQDHSYFYQNEPKVCMRMRTWKEIRCNFLSNSAVRFSPTPKQQTKCWDDRLSFGLPSQLRFSSPEAFFLCVGACWANVTSFMLPSAVHFLHWPSLYAEHVVRLTAQ